MQKCRFCLDKLRTNVRKGPGASLGLAAFAVALPTGSLVRTTYITKQAEKAREKRVQKGERGLENFAHEALSTCIPTYLLLSDEDRSSIRELIQVCTTKRNQFFCFCFQALILPRQADDRPGLRPPCRIG